MRKNWTPEEKQFLRENYGLMPRQEIARALNKTIPAVSNMAGRLGLRQKKEPRWTPEEDRFLRENWHSMAIRTLARRLKRTTVAIDVRAKRLKLGPQVHPGMFTLKDICDLFKIGHRKVKKYIAAGQMRVKKAPVKTSQGYDILLFSPAELRRFLREHPEAWDARKVNIAEVKRQIRLRERAYEHIEAEKEDGGNAKEQRIPEHLRPAFALFVADIAINISDRIVAARQENKLTLEWFKQKVKQDMEKERWRLRWTPEDDRRLREMFRSGRYTYQEMAERLGRTASAVGHRLARIDVWTEEAI
jgi:hypothetical protein